MKLELSSIFEVSRYLTTKSGKELQEALEYLAQFCNLVVTALTGKLSYEDNFLCEVKQIGLVSGIETVVFSNQKARVKEVRLRRLISRSNYVSTGFGWAYNADGQIVVTCTISGSPTGIIPAEVIIYY